MRKKYVKFRIDYTPIRLQYIQYRSNFCFSRFLVSGKCRNSWYLLSIHWYTVKIFLLLCLMHVIFLFEWLTVQKNAFFIKFLRKALRMNRKLVVIDFWLEAKLHSQERPQVLSWKGKIGCQNLKSTQKYFRKICHQSFGMKRKFQVKTAF